MKLNFKMSSLIVLTFLAVIVTVSTKTKAQELISIAGCTDTNLIDGGSVSKITTVGTSYSPKCLKVKLGSTITIDASRHHPLAAMSDIANAKNPFSDADEFTTPQTRVMSNEGVFGYYCTAHGDSEGDGMAGIIVVVK